MKSVFVVYHDVNTEARSKEILEMSVRLADTILVSYSKPTDVSGYKAITTGRGRRKYVPFILKAIHTLWKEKPEIVVLHDSYTVPLIPIMRLTNKRAYLIFDSSELNIERSSGSKNAWVTNLFRMLAKKYMRKIDTIIAANKERAEIMLKHYRLEKMPIVFDNIHLIKDDFDPNCCEKKYAEYLDGSAFTLVYGGGIAVKRMTYEIAEAIGALGDKYKLIIVGNSSGKELMKFKKFLSERHIQNVYYLGFIPRNEWRFLLSKAQISISAFDQKTFNNKYCASGKLYESLFEGVPILTSENPPLKRICEENQIGVSTDNFHDGILAIERDYDRYKVNVQKYVKNIDYENRIVMLAKTIRAEIDDKVVKCETA